jgi:DNA-binding NarL/FixJ family response regulator
MAKQVSEENPPVRVFIVEDHPVYRDGLANLISSKSGWGVCGEAGNAKEALAEVERLKPNVVLVDIALPGRNGLELIKDLHATAPQAAVLVLSMHDELLYAERVLRAGGRGYIMKEEGPERIVEAIRTVLGGQIYLSSRMSTRLLDSFSGHPGRNHSAMSKLTDRQLEILQLTGEGEDSRGIARKLNLSIKTVDAHRVQIRARLELRNFTELVSYAARWVETQRSTQTEEVSNGESE